MVLRMDIVILLFDRFEPLDAIGPYEILAHVPGAKVRFVAPKPGLITDVLGSLPVDVPTSYSDVEACDVLLIPGGGGVRPLLDDQDFLESLGEFAHAVRFERPGHRDFVNAQTDRFGLGFVDTEIVERLTDIEIGFSRGDDAKARLGAVDDDAVEPVGAGMGTGQ